MGGLACKVGREVNTLGCGDKEVLEMGTRIWLRDIHESIMSEKAMEVVKGRNEKMEDKLNKINMIGDKNGIGGRIWTKVNTLSKIVANKDIGQRMRL